MAGPTNELMMQILIALREDMSALRDQVQRSDTTSLREELAAFRAETMDRFDVNTERLNHLGKTTSEGFATLTVAHRRSDDFVRAVDRESTDLKARVVALELRVAQLERQD